MAFNVSYIFTARDEYSAIAKKIIESNKKIILSSNKAAKSFLKQNEAAKKLKNSLVGLNKEFVNTNKSVISNNSSISDLTSKLKTLSAETKAGLGSATNNDLSEMDGRYIILAKTVAVSSKKIKKSNKSIAQTNLGSSGKDLLSLEEKYKKLAKNVKLSTDKLKGSIKELNASNRKLKTSNNRLVTSNEKLKDSLKKSKESIAKLKKGGKSLSKSNAKLKESLNNTSRSSRRTKKEFNKLSFASITLRATFVKLRIQTNLNKNASKGLTNQLKKFAALALAGLGIAKLIQEGSAFQDAMLDLSAITGSSGKDLEGLKGRIRELALEYKTMPSDVATAMKAVASAKPELLKNAVALSSVTESVLLLKKAAGIETADAVMTLTRGLNIFGKGADQAAKFVDILAAGAKFGSAEIRDAGQSVLLAGGAAVDAGLSFLQLNSAIQVVAKGGFVAEKSGTGLQAIFLRLTEAGFDFKKLGVEGVMDQVAKGLAKIKDPATKAATKSKLFGLEHIKIASALLRNIPLIGELNKKLETSGVAAEQAKIRMSSFSSNVDEAKVRLSLLASKIFDRSLPALNSLTESTNDFLGGFDTSDIEAFSLTLSILAGAAKVVGAVFGFVFNQILTSLKPVLAIMKGIADIIGQLVGAIATLDFSNFDISKSFDLGGKFLGLFGGEEEKESTFNQASENVAIAKKAKNIVISNSDIKDFAKKAIGVNSNVLEFKVPEKVLEVATNVEDIKIPAKTVEVATNVADIKLPAKTLKLMPEVAAINIPDNVVKISANVESIKIPDSVKNQSSLENLSLTSNAGRNKIIEDSNLALLNKAKIINITNSSISKNISVLNSIRSSSSPLVNTNVSPVVSIAPQVSTVSSGATLNGNITVSAAPGSKVESVESEVVFDGTQGNLGLGVAAGA